jgi:Secretion system C-terminal sorting domain/Right handed beta helix region
MSTASAGDTVFIASGSYTESLVLGVSGKPNQWITFKGTSADSVYVDGTGLGAGSLLSIDSQHHVQVLQIHFKNNIHLNALGIYIDQASHHITIADCKVSNICFSANAADTANTNTNANPMLVYGNRNTPITNIKIESNEIYDCRPGYSEGLTIDGNVDTFIISQNKVHHITNIGIDMAGHYGVSPDPATDQPRHGICAHNLVYHCASPYADAAGIYADGSADNIIEQNTVHHCQYGIEVGCEVVGTVASGIVVRNNFIHSNLTTGIAFGGYDYPSNSGKVIRCQLQNNTCYHNDIRKNGNGELVMTYSENCSIVNNIFYNDYQSQLLTCQTGNSVMDTLNYNCWYRLGGQASVKFTYGGNTYNSYNAYRLATGQDAHSIFGNPLFRLGDTTSPDLHIRMFSACLNAGNIAIAHSAGPYDIDGDPRIFNGYIDIGADELTQIASINDINSSTLNIYPNPAQNLITIETPSSAKGETLQLLDISGRLLNQFEILSTSSIIETSSLPSGIYLIKLINSVGLCAISKLVIP